MFGLHAYPVDWNSLATYLLSNIFSQVTNSIFKLSTFLYYFSDLCLNIPKCGSVNITSTRTNIFLTSMHNWMFFSKVYQSFKNLEKNQQIYQLTTANVQVWPPFTISYFHLGKHITENHFRGSKGNIFLNDFFMNKFSSSINQICQNSTALTVSHFMVKIKLE
jgi:hypothetical protein